MADAANIQNLLAALAAQRPATTPTQTPPSASNTPYPPPSSSAGPTAPYQAPPPGVPGYGVPGAPGLPAPASSGSLDLSAVRPVNSGTLNFNDTLAKVRASAADKGVTSYDRPLVFGQDRSQDRPYTDSRSRSPPRGDYHDRSNPYRDERRRGHGREQGGRDRSYSPGPRGRQFSPRNGRERSPVRGGGDDQSEIMQIESSLVGLIIGRQGENLRRIEADFDCRVQFLPAVEGQPRQCKISGPRHRREDVKTAINRIIEDSGMAPLNRSQDKSRDAHKGGATALRDGEDHIQIMVPDRTVGLIIGRGGETIRDLQERSGCHINIVGENKSVNGLRPVNLIGTPESAAKAKDAIMEIVDSDSRGEATGSRAGPAPPRSNEPRRDAGGQGGPGGPDKVNDSIYVPSEAVGMIIGKGGETIRDMQSSTGCKINVSQSSGPGETEREIALVGSRDAISRAKVAIEEKVDAVRQKSGGGGGGGGRGRGHQDYDRSGGYGQQGSGGQPTNNSSQAPAGDANDPYAQYGGYQNYVALWYQSLMYQQQQGGQGTPPAGAPAPGS